MSPLLSFALNLTDDTTFFPQLNKICSIYSLQEVAATSEWLSGASRSSLN